MGAEARASHSRSRRGGLSIAGGLRQTGAVADTEQGTPKLRRSADRFLTRSDGCTTRHSFSFGPHYDPAEVGYGPLVAVNDETCPGGAGYARHPHESVELVTWVVEGRLKHSRGDRSTTVLAPDAVQVLTVPGRDEHAETNADARDPVRFLQVWFRLDSAPSGSTRHQVGVADLASAGPAWTVLAASGPAPVGALTLRTPGVSVAVSRLESRTSVSLPLSPYAHLLVIRGEARLGEYDVATGDAVRLTDPDRTREADGVAVTASQPTDLLLCTVG